MELRVEYTKSIAWTFILLAYFSRTEERKRILVGSFGCFRHWTLAVGSLWETKFQLVVVTCRNKMADRVEKKKDGNLSVAQKSLRRKRLREIRHRAQSLVEGATDPWKLEEEYETPIPEAEEEEFIDEETAEVAEEVIEYTNMVRELIAETTLGQYPCLFNIVIKKKCFISRIAVIYLEQYLETIARNVPNEKYVNTK